MSSSRHRVVVIGGGFGGLKATRALADADVDVTLIDRTNHHLFQPLLYQVAAGLLAPGLIAPALRHIISDQRNAEAVLADVYDIDVDRKIVLARIPDGRTHEFPYDSLVVAAGATHSYFGKDELAEFAPGMKTIEDARFLRDSILSKFEMAELTEDPQERDEWLTFVVIGAGPTGVELVGQIAELAHKVLPHDYRRFDTTSARIILLEGADAVLPPFPRPLQRYTRRRLEMMGVEVRVKSLAVDMDHHSVTIKGPKGIETIRARTRVWAAGVAASPLAKLLAEKTGATVDRAGRIEVAPDCSVPGHPEIYAVGDMASLNRYPGVAQVAMQEGQYVADTIKARVEGGQPDRPFTYFDKGSMATIGYRSAVASAFGLRFTGVIAYLMWGVVHVAYLVGWGNRLGAMWSWARALVNLGSRSHRIISYGGGARRKYDAGSTSAILPHSTPLPADGQSVHDEVQKAG